LEEKFLMSQPEVIELKKKLNPSFIDLFSAAFGSEEVDANHVRMIRKKLKQSALTKSITQKLTLS
jgi:hypothetical protein